MNDRVPGSITERPTELANLSLRKPGTSFPPLLLQYLHMAIWTAHHVVGLQPSHMELLKLNLKKEVVTSSGTVFNPSGTPQTESKKGSGN